MDSSTAAPIVRYPRFSAADFQQREDDRIKAVETFLAYITQVAGIEAVREHGTVVRDTPEELVIDHHFGDFGVRVNQLRDVSYADKGSYTKARRAQELEKLSEENMTTAEPVMGRGVESLLTAQQMHRGEAPPIPMRHATKDNPEENENRGKWYKTMRVESCRRFWIRREDTSHAMDYFWEHQRNQGAAADEEIYVRVSRDIVITLDKDSSVLVCKFKRLFQFLFGEKGKNKVDDAIRKWSSLPPLPVPETVRHMVDDLIRQRHPELDLEKAQPLEELEQRYQCVVHYGTWAMQGRTDPDFVFRTVDTIFGRGRPRKVQEDIPGKLFLEFKATGPGSEVARYLFQAAAPAEHRECCDVFQALPKTDRVGLSGPTFATLFALRINSFTGRHADKTDVRHGFTGLVALGDYVEPLSPEPETLYEADIQGPAYIPSDLLYADSKTGSSDKSSASSYLDHGRIMVEGPEFKKRKTEN
ncbi:hypothetical protein DL764_003639 [Monosporascus ibericus]|uniref:Uncharacterized protein n=1 Tax=Monosporascus ibericus TaxID=155417 RepID=A0A4Q4TIE5_9PEZI|nr:hypothetical protein DL764_003639 [Monosporascus ibericus]